MYIYWNVSEPTRKIKITRSRFSHSNNEYKRESVARSRGWSLTNKDSLSRKSIFGHCSAFHLDISVNTAWLFSATGNGEREEQTLVSKDEPTRVVRILNQSTLRPTIFSPDIQPSNVRILLQSRQTHSHVREKCSRRHRRWEKIRNLCAYDEWWQVCMQRREDANCESSSDGMTLLRMFD